MAMFEAVRLKDLAALHNEVSKPSTSGLLRDESGNTALHVAAELGWTAGVKLLLSKNYSITSTNNDGYTALHSAASAGELETVDQILQHRASIDATTLKGENVLHLAIHSKGDRAGMLKALLRYGANVHGRTEAGESPLHTAAQGSGDLIQLVNILLENAASLDALDNNDNTPLHLACRAGNCEVALLLMEKGAKIMLPNLSGMCPIHEAASQAKLPSVVIEKMLKLGCDVNHKMQRGRRSTPLHLAAASSVSLFNYLLGLGADIEATDASKSTIMHYAARNSSPDMISIIARDYPHLLNARNDDGQTPGHIACEENAIHTLERLLEFKIDINAQDNKGRSLLHVACVGQRPSVAKILLSHHAAVGVADNNKTALDFLTDVNISMGLLLEACGDDHPEVIRLLRRPDMKVKYEPLHKACRTGNVRAIQVLLTNGHSLNETVNHHAALDSIPKTAEGLSAVLKVVCTLGLLRHIPELIARGANPNCLSMLRGFTVLQEALIKQRNDVAIALIEAGADPKHRTRSAGSYPLAMILESCDERVVHCAVDAMTKKGQIDLSNCGITTLSQHAVQYIVLKGLPVDLRANDLHTIPPDFAELDKVRIGRNPLSHVPERLREGEWAQVRKYLRTIAVRASMWNEARLLFVGQEGVGKTTLLECFKKKKGKVSCKEDMSTNGIQVHRNMRLKTGESGQKAAKRGHSKDDSGSVSFNAWDLGGQEVFYPTHQFFLTNNSIYIVVFNMVEPEFSRIEYWMRLIRSLSGNTMKSPIFLVGTHIDDLRVTEQHATETAEHLERTYPKYTFAGMQGLFLVSCKTGQGMDELRQKLAQLGQKGAKQIAPSWVRLHDCIAEVRSSLQFTHVSELYRWGRESGIQSEDEMKMAFAFLCDAGAIIHFNDNASLTSMFDEARGTFESVTGSIKALSDLVVLNPQWLADIMSSMVTFRHTWIRNGMLDLAHTNHVFEDHPATLHSVLLSLLEKFSIIFKMRESNFIMVPSMLPPAVDNEQLEEHWPSSQTRREVGRVFWFPFLPLGFMSRLVVRCLHLPDVEGVLFWRNGVVLRIGSRKELSLVSFNEESFEVSIRARSETREYTLFRDILTAIETLIECYYKTVQVDRMVPCIHCIKQGLSNSKAYMFTFPELVDALERHQLFVFCNSIRSRSRCVRLDLLAPDIVFSDMAVLSASALVVGGQLASGGYGRVFRGWLLRDALERKKSDVRDEPVEDCDSDVATDDSESGDEAQSFVTGDSRPWVGGGSAVDLSDDERYMEVAVKELIMKKTSTKDRVFREFQTEAHLMSCLDHKNILRLYGVTLKPLRMALEIAPHSDLMSLILPAAEHGRGRISKEAFPWRLRLLIALDIARGMRYLASMNPPIVHRDLRSQNIFLVSLAEDVDAVRAKVADFGLSKIVVNELSGALRTWQWLAPEILAEEPRYDERSDIYSFAMVCWEIAARAYPYVEFDQDPRFVAMRGGGEGEKFAVVSELAVKEAVLTEGLRPTIPSEADEGCPSEFAGIISQCWVHDATERLEWNVIVQTLCSILNIEDTEKQNFSAPRLPERASRGRSTSLFQKARRKVLDFQKIVDVVQIEEYHDALVGSARLSGVDRNIWVGKASGALFRISNSLKPVDGNVIMSHNGLVSMTAVDATNCVWTAGEDGVVRAWDEAGLLHKECVPFGHKSNARIRCMSLIGPGVWLLSTSHATIRVVDATSMSVRHSISLEERDGKTATCIVSAPPYVLLGVARGILVIEADTFTVLGALEEDSMKNVTSITVTKGNGLWAGTKSGALHVYSIIDNEFQYRKGSNVHREAVRCLFALGAYVFSGSDDGNVIIWNAAEAIAMQEVPDVHSEGMCDVVIVNETNFVCFGSAGEVARFTVRPEVLDLPPEPDVEPRSPGLVKLGNNRKRTSFVSAKRHSGYASPRGASRSFMIGARSPLGVKLSASGQPSQPVVDVSGAESSGYTSLTMSAPAVVQVSPRADGPDVAETSDESGGISTGRRATDSESNV